MNVLVTVVPGHGHFNPVVPVARALAAAGHDVRVATSPSFCPTVRRAGLAAAPAGLDWLEAHPELIFPELAGLAPRERGAALGRIFNGSAPRAMIDDLVAMVADWPPDLVVLTPAELGGLVVAEWAQLPYSLVRSFIPAPLGRAMVGAGGRGRAGTGAQWAGLNALRSELGLAPFVPEQEPFPSLRYLTLDPVPPSLHLLTGNHVSPTSHPLRPVPFNLANEGAASPALEDLPSDRSTVVVSLGSVFDRATEVLQAVIQALAGEEVNLIVGIGPSNPAVFGAVPPHVRLARWVPFDTVLPRCDLLITHGGWGSMMAALSLGLPMLVLPQGADNLVNALRIRSVGAGRFLAPTEVSPAMVREEAAELLSRPIYRLNARRLQAEIEAMPGPASVVSLLEQLARDREPFVAPAPLWPGAVGER